MVDPLTTTIAQAVIGGTVGSVFTAALERGRNKKIERIERFGLLLSERLNRLECKCDEETIVDLINRAALAAATDARDEKLYVMARVLEGTYCAELDDAHSRLFMDLISRFDVYHLQVLRVLRDDVGSDLGSKGDARPSFPFAELHKALISRSGRSGDEMRDITALVMSDLVNAGMVNTRIQAKSRGAMVNINPAGLLRMQTFSLSALGRMFAQYIEKEAEERFNL